jgi:hypothetical protein
MIQGIYKMVFTSNLNQGHDCKMGLLTNNLYINVRRVEIIKTFNIIERVGDVLDVLKIIKTKNIVKIMLQLTPIAS